jgi:hypothetical protein
LVAVTVKVYAVPLVRPVNTQLVELPVRAVEHDAGVATDGLDVTVKPVGAEPPLLAGAVQCTVAEALPPVTAPIVGALVTVAAVTLLEAAEAPPVPAALVAFTVNVYAVPAVRPALTVHERAAVEQVPPVGLEVTV